MTKIVWSVEKLKKVLSQKEPLRDEKNIAAVLIPIIAGEEIKLIFEKRPYKIKRHSGEISFPGGLIEENESSKEAALRETYEELGIPSEKISILGYLEPERTKSTGYLIIPVVGLLKEEPNFKINKNEIEEVVIVKLNEIINNRKEMILGPYYKVEDKVIWGATARILEKFLDKMRQAGLLID